MLSSHASKSLRSMISLFFNVLVVASMVLGSFSTAIAQGSRPSEMADQAENDLVIKQGSSVRYHAFEGQTLQFDLDVAAPVEGALYTWTLLNPPRNGDAVLSPRGAAVTVAYSALIGFSREDLFTVQVSDTNGQTARISVVVEISVNPGAHGTRPTFKANQWRPATNSSRTVEEMRANAFLQEEKSSFLAFQRAIDLPHSLPPWEPPVHAPEIANEFSFNGAYTPNLPESAPVTITEATEDTFIAELVPGDTHVGLIIDGPVEESNSFTWMAHQGLENAKTNLGINGDEYVKTEANTYADLFTACADTDANDMCIGLGWSMTDAITTAASNYPAVKFVILDGSPETSLANLRGVEFRTEEAAYLAGVLAAEMSQSYAISAIGGMNIPPVTAFTRGYRNGAQCTKEKRVVVDFINDFMDQERAAEMAGDMMDFGADVIFPVAGAAGDGALLAAVNAGKWAIGVDVDQWVTTFNNGLVSGSDKLLTSVLKRMDIAVVESVQDLLAETFTSGMVSYGLAENGVGLAPYHGADGEIPPYVKDKIDSIKNQIISKTVNANQSCVIPQLIVRPEMGWVYGSYWPASSTVSLTIDGVDEGSRTVVWEEGEFVFCNLDIATGSLLVLDDGEFRKEHTVLELHDISYDEVADTVSGVTTPNAWVNVWACDENNCAGIDIQAGSGGAFTADMTQIDIDIAPGTFGGVGRWDDDNDGTVIDWYVPNPHIEVYPETNSVLGWEWPANTTVELSISGKGTYAGHTDQYGGFNFDALEVDIVAGDEVIVSGGGKSKSHTVLELRDITYDEVADTVSGVTTPNAWVNVSACDEDNCAGIDWQAGPGGAFTADMTQIDIDIAPGTFGGVGRWDDDGDGTVIDWRVPNPTITVNPETNSVWGREWPANTTVELSISGKGTYAGHTDKYGGFNFDTLEVDIVAGDEVSVSGGGKSKSHTVMELHDISYDEVADTVSGVTTPNAWVNVWACDENNCDGIDIQAGSGGAFTADMAQIDIDIAPGTEGNVGRWDDDGDGTVIDWRVPSPHIAVNPETNSVWGREWPANTDVELSISGKGTYAGHTNMKGQFNFNALEVDIVVGDEVSVSGGGKSKSHTVMELRDISYDEVADTVSGVTTPNAWVNVWACDENNCDGIDWQAGAGGAFTADMAQIDIDIAPGTEGNVGRWDDDGDGTVIDWRVPTPSFSVNPETNSVWGREWPANTTVELSVSGKGTYAGHTNENGEFNFDALEVDIVVGDEVIVSGGGKSKSHTVMELHDISYDEVADTVSGVATPNAWGFVWACDEDNCAGIDWQAGPGGAFTADMTQIDIDIAPGTFGGVVRWDDDGDGTELNWRVPNPHIEVNPFENQVLAWDLKPETQVTLSIGTYKTTGKSDTGGFVEFNTSRSSFDILPGQMVVVTDGTTTRRLTVTNIAVTGFNQAADLVFGTAAPGSQVFVVAKDSVGRGWGDLYRANTSGVWTADFSGYEDIAEGTWGWVSQEDADGDSTTINWVVLPPAPANDLLESAEELILPLGETIHLNTRSATTSTSDPALGACMNWRYSLTDKGRASVWYRYVATQDGALLIDTKGSEFDTALAVYAGTPSTTTRIACNDDLSSTDMDSSVLVSVNNGKTYFIEVVDTGFTKWKSEVGISESPQTQEVGGELSLNVELTPCYSLTVTADPSSGGTVTRSPAPNCLGTKYASGTQATLSALPKATTNFWKWSDDKTDNVRSFTIETDVTLTASFVGIPGMVSLSSPASGALLHLEDVAPKTPITLKWLKTSVPSVKYEWQIARNPQFTDDLRSGETSELQLQPDGLEAKTTYYWRVRGINAAGGQGAWSAARNFKVAVLKPTDLDVLDEEYTNRPQFEWTKVDGASGYTIQVSKFSNFSSLLTTGTVTGEANTRFTPAVNLPATTDLWWRVRANSATYGPGLYAESVTSFTVPAAPAIPALSLPANNALVITRTPTLKWLAVKDATGYLYQVAKDPEFMEVVVQNNEELDDLSVTLSELDPAATYYWRVRAKKDLLMSGWSTARTLRVALPPPTLTAPENGWNVQHLRPTLEWEPVPGATGYTLQISRNSTFTSLVGTYNRTAAQTDYTPTANLPAKTSLYWRVQTKSTLYGPSAWSDPFMMEMPNPPPTPVQKSPAVNALVFAESNPWLDWTDVNVPDFQYYQVIVSTEADCSAWNVRNESPTESQFTLDYAGAFVPNKKYYWTVRAFNTQSQWSAWSPCRAFRAAVAAPELMEPADDPDTALKTNRPEFKWKAVEGASGYTIQLSRNAAFTSIVATGNASGLAWTPSVNLPEVKLYWRVRANSTTNGPGAWSNQYPMPSTYWSFIPGAPLPIPALVAPNNSYLWTEEVPVDLKWNYTVPASKTLDGYLVQVARDDAFSDKAVNVTRDDHLQVLSYPLNEGVLEAGKTYYWRVAASFTDETYTGWSTARTLRVAVPPPTLTTPENGVNPLHLRPTLGWEPVPGATGYTLQISRNSNFTSLVGTYSRTAAQTDYTPTANLPAKTSLYWRVQTKSTLYGPSAWSAPRSLEMPNPPGIPNLVAPATGATLTTRNPRLDWSNATLPALETWGKYEVQLATDIAFTNVVLEELVGGLITNSEYTVEDGLLSGTYYWRVRAYNGKGEFSGWSSVRNFKISAPVLRVGTTQIINSLDPVYAGNSSDLSYLGSMYEGLTRYDENLNTIPAAASGWEYNEDDTELTFTLRPGLKYSDGSLLNAKRFEYAIQRFLSIEDAPFSGYLNVVEQVEARDPYGDLCTSYTQTNCLTLWLRFKEPAAYVHTLMAMSMFYPAKAEKISAGGANWWAKPANHVGNGPFNLSTFNAGGISTLLPNKYYRGGVPTYRMEYHYYEDEGEALNAYRADNLDMVGFMAYQVEEVKSDPKLNAEKRLDNGSRTLAIMFNQSKEPFQDPQIRKAFSLATDRETLVNEVFGGSENVNLSWIAPGFPGYDGEYTQWGYNSSAADQAMTASSYGDPASVPPITVTYPQNPLNDSMWEWLKTHWEDELGVTIYLDPVDPGAFYELLDNGSAMMFMNGWTADNPDPQNWISLPWRNDGVFAQRTHYSNPAFDALLAQADGDPNPVSRLQKYQTAQRMLIDDMPLMPIYNRTNKFLVKPWVQGVLPAALDYTWAGELVPLAVSIK